jgi:hypothetical protein
MVFKKTGSGIYQYKINNKVRILKGEISISVDNPSEDGLYMFIVVSRIEGGVYWKMWPLSGTFLF